jgi:chromosome partitioning protein
MKPSVITINGQKGGIGKTTKTAHIAAGLALRGKRVLAVDADPQSHLTISYGIDPEPGIYQVLVRNDDILDYLRQPAPEVYQIAGQPCSGRLYILPSNEESAAIPSLVKDVRLLKEHLALLEGAIDVVVIDTPPTPGLLMAVIHQATDYVLVPTELERLSLESLLTTINDLRKYEVELMAVLPTFADMRRAIHHHNLKWLVKTGFEQKWPLFMPIGDRNLWKDASQAGRMVWTMHPTSKSDRAAIAEALRLVEQVEKVIHVQVSG